MISIILPTYNGSKYISKAIRSVLSQSFIDWELLVIDDGSTDGTEDIVRGYISKDKRIIFYKNEINLGIQKTLNRGLKEAKGKYVARIDDDDEWVDKNKLQKQFDFLNNNPEYVLVGTGCIVVGEDSVEIYRYLLPQTDDFIRSKMLFKNCFVHSSVMFSKDRAIKAGGYSEDSNLLHIEDYDLWLRIGLLGKMANINEYCIIFTLRENSLSSKNKVWQLKKILKLVKRNKNNYPNYFMAIVTGYIRFVLYKTFCFITPVPVMNFIKNIYKKYW